MASGNGGGHGSGGGAGGPGRQNYDLEQIWADLRDGIEQIFARRGMTHARYIELYSHVYNYCTNVHQANTASGSLMGSSANGNVGASLLTGGHAGGRGGSNTNRGARRGAAPGGAQFVGLELYRKLKEYLKEYQVKLLSVSCCLLTF